MPDAMCGVKQLPRALNSHTEDIMRTTLGPCIVQRWGRRVLSSRRHSHEILSKYSEKWSIFIMYNIERSLLPHNFRFNYRL